MKTISLWYCTVIQNTCPYIFWVVAFQFFCYKGIICPTTKKLKRAQERYCNVKKSLKEHLELWRTLEYGCDTILEVELTICTGILLELPFYLDLLGDACSLIHGLDAFWMLKQFYYSQSTSKCSKSLTYLAKYCCLLGGGIMLRC